MRAPATWLTALVAALGLLSLGASGATAAPTAPAASGASVASVMAAPAATGATSAAPHELIVVSAGSYHSSYATFTAYQVTGSHRTRVFGPWTARIGRDGFAPPGQKREGDGRTPSGDYAFSFMFGIDANPGVHYSYRVIHPDDYWDDDSTSPRYNEWVDINTANPGADPEPMYVSAYDYGAVIAYNTARTPHLGSAIFLHLNIGEGTAGCVTLPRAELLAVLRWLKPAQSPRLDMGVDVS